MDECKESLKHQAFVGLPLLVARVGCLLDVLETEELLRPEPPLADNL
jgi:hypothetical protein